MDQFEKKRENILDFWNNRAQLLERAGSNDLIAKKMEIATIARHISDGMRILEIGCGNGIAAIELARRFDVIVEAIDFSVEMIEAAKDPEHAKHIEESKRRDPRYLLRKMEDSDFFTDGSCDIL